MKNLFIFSILFLGIAVFSIGQTNLSLKFSPKDGNIFTKENNLFVTTFNIAGLNSDKELANFTSTMKANAIVNQFETAPKVAGQTEYKATLKLNTKDKTSIIALLQSVNVTTLIVKDKSYTLDQYDQISKDIKPVVVKEKTKSASGN